MADNVLNPPQHSSGVVGSRGFFKQSKKQRDISDIQVEGASNRSGMDQSGNWTGRKDSRQDGGYRDSGMVM